jgi:hypothetical protein
MPILALFLLALWIFCIVDVFISEEPDVRNLPRLAWLFVVLLVPDIGSMAWLVFGRPLKREVTDADPPPEASTPDDDQEFLRRVRKRAEEQRRAAREHGAAEDET